MNRKQNPKSQKPKFQINNPQDASRETMNNKESTFGSWDLGFLNFDGQLAR